MTTAHEDWVVESYQQLITALRELKQLHQEQLDSLQLRITVLEKEIATLTPQWQHTISRTYLRAHVDQLERRVAELERGPTVYDGDPPLSTPPLIGHQLPVPEKTT